MDCSNGCGKRRTFHWSDEVRQLVADHRRRIEKVGDHRGSDKEQILSKLVQISGNPRDACLRFPRRLGVAEKCRYREWTTREQQRLIELMDDVPVEEAGAAWNEWMQGADGGLARPSASARAGNGSPYRCWPKLCTLAVMRCASGSIGAGSDAALFRRRAVKVQIIDADDFCSFIKNYGREVVGNRLSYEGLAFVRDYMFPRSHADQLLVRGPYNEAPKQQAAKPVMSDLDDFEENLAEQSA